MCSADHKTPYAAMVPEGSCVELPSILPHISSTTLLPLPRESWDTDLHQLASPDEGGREGGREGDRIVSCEGFEQGLWVHLDLWDTAHGGGDRVSKEEDSLLQVWDGGEELH